VALNKEFKVSEADLFVLEAIRELNIRKGNSFDLRANVL
jgi:hypothetical protein